MLPRSSNSTMYIDEHIFEAATEDPQDTPQEEVIVRPNSQLQRVQQNRRRHKRRPGTTNLTTNIDAQKLHLSDNEVAASPIRNIDRYQRTRTNSNPVPITHLSQLSAVLKLDALDNDLSQKTRRGSMYPGALDSLHSSIEQLLNTAVPTGKSDASPNDNMSSSPIEKVEKKRNILHKKFNNILRRNSDDGVAIVPVFINNSNSTTTPESEKVVFSETAETDPIQRQRELVINEIITTERIYVEDLKIIIDHFLTPLREKGLPKEETQILFGNIEVLHSINSDLLAEFTCRSEEAGNFNIAVGDIFLRLHKYFRLYTMYCLNQQEVPIIHRRLLAENSVYYDHLREQQHNPLCRKLDLIDLLIKPMQRLCKYPLLLKEILAVTNEQTDDYQLLLNAKAEFSEVVNYINERKRLGENQQKVIDIQHSIENCPSLLSAARKFLREANILKANLTKPTHRKRRRMFLFNDSIVIAKNSKSKERGKPYIFCSFILMQHLRIIDCSDSDVLKHYFELSHQTDKSKSFYIISKDFETKLSWLKDLRTIIKSYQKKDYTVMKTNLLKESEERERRESELMALNRKEVQPTTSENTDVWTMGLILWQLYTGKPLFPTLTFEQAAVAFMDRNSFFLPNLEEENIPADLKNILLDCWMPNKDARPNFSMLFDRIRSLDTSRPANPLDLVHAEYEAKKQEQMVLLRKK